MILKTNNEKKIIISDDNLASFKNDIENELALLEGKEELTQDEINKHDEYNNYLDQIDSYKNELNETIIKLAAKSKQEGLTNEELFELNTSMNTYNSLVDYPKENIENTPHM